MVRTASDLVAAHVDTMATLNAENWINAKIFADESVWALPYGASSGMPTAIATHTDRAEGVKKYLSIIKNPVFSKATISRVSDTECWAEYTLNSTSTLTGREYNQHYVVHAISNDQGQLVKLTEFYDSVKLSHAFEFGKKE